MGQARFGYGVVAAAFGAQAVAIGLSMSAYPIFIESLEGELGATRTQTSFGIPVLIVTAALLGPSIGRAVDRGSPRRVMVAGALLMMAGMLGISRAPDLLWAAAIWSLVLGPGHALLGPLPAMTVLANWFVARRTTMIGIAAMGTTIGGAIVPPFGELLVQNLGWRAALLCMGFAAAAIGVPTVLLGIRKSPEERGAYPDGAASAPALEPDGDASARSILSDRRFWPIACAFACMHGVGVAFLTHIVPFADERGLSRELAVTLLSINALCSAFGKLVFGVLTDRLGARLALISGVALQLVGWIGLLASTGSLSFTLAAACFALGMGCVMPCAAGFVAALYGRARFGQASGLVALLAMLGAVSVAPLVGSAYDATGSYGAPLTSLLVLIALPAVLVAPLRIPGDVRHAFAPKRRERSPAR